MRYKTKKRILLFFSILFTIALFGLSFSFWKIYVTPKTVAKISNTDDSNLSIDNVYLKYQFRLLQYDIQKKFNKNTKYVDDSFWNKEDNGNTRLDQIKNILIKRTKEQLVALKYAKDNNIILDDKDKEKIYTLIKKHSSPDELTFITDGEELNKKIFDKIFENIVLSEKAIEVGADKEKVTTKNSDKTRVVLAEELIIKLDYSSDKNKEENQNIKKKFSEKILELAKSGESFENLASKYKLAYKDNVKLSEFNISEDDPNRNAILEAIKLKKDQLSTVLPYYEKNDDKNDKNDKNDKKNKEELKAFLIFKCINENVPSESNENSIKESKEIKIEQFKKSLLNELHKTDFDINEQIIKNLN